MKNTEATGIANNTIKQQRSHAMTMRYFWIRDQKTFKIPIAWKLGKLNIADYFTKHNSVKYYKRVRPIYLQTDEMPQAVPLVLLNPSLQGCLDP